MAKNHPNCINIYLHKCICLVALVVVLKHSKIQLDLQFPLVPAYPFRLEALGESEKSIGVDTVDLSRGLQQTSTNPIRNFLLYIKEGD